LSDHQLGIEPPDTSKQIKNAAVVPVTVNEPVTVNLTHLGPAVASHVNAEAV
jgi:hypothetical protein